MEARLPEKNQIDETLSESQSFIKAIQQRSWLRLALFSGYAFANYLMYYSTKIDTLFLPRTTAGGKVYELEYLCTVSIVYGLGASFAYQVSQFDIQVRT